MKFLLMALLSGVSSGIYYLHTSDIYNDSEYKLWGTYFENVKTATLVTQVFSNTT